MTTDAVLDADGAEVPEGIARRGRHRAVQPARPAQAPTPQLRNSRTGSMYVVKPKMHGPDEVAFADDLFAAVEDAARPGPPTP